MFVGLLAWFDWPPGSLSSRNPGPTRSYQFKILRPFQSHDMFSPSHHGLVMIY